MFKEMSIVNLNNVKLQPLSNQEFITILREFSTIIKSCIGPKGNLKLLVTGGNYSQLTSLSFHLMERLDLNNPICHYIATIIKSEPDFGLYTGVIISYLLQKALTAQTSNNFSNRMILESIEELMLMCTELLNSEKASYVIDFTSTNIFITLAKNILTSKSSTDFIKANIIDLCVQIVKAFIMSLDIDNFKEGKILIMTETGQEEFKTYDGILYQYIESNENILQKIKKLQLLNGDIHVLIFTNMLTEQTNNKDSTESICDEVLIILKQSVKLNIHIIACQKVIDKSIKLYLHQEGIIVLDRLGTEQTEALLELSGALPISDIDPSIKNDLHTMTGTIKSINYISSNSKQYILLENHSKNIVTLLISCSILAGQLEMKKLIQQVLACLKGVLQNPKVTYGSGCLEVWLSVQLQLIKETKKELNKVQICCLDWFQKAMISATGISFPVAVDTVYYHAWPAENTDWSTCNCKLITKNLIEISKGTWLPLHQHGNLITAHHIQPEYSCSSSYSTFIQPELNLGKNVIIDSFIHKKNAIILALEACINILSIGLIIYKK